MALARLDPVGSSGRRCAFPELAALAALAAHVIKLLVLVLLLPIARHVLARRSLEPALPIKTLVLGRIHVHLARAFDAEPSFLDETSNISNQVAVVLHPELGSADQFLTVAVREILKKVAAFHSSGNARPVRDS